MSEENGLRNAHLFDEGGGQFFDENDLSDGDYGAWEHGTAWERRRIQNEKWREKPGGNHKKTADPQKIGHNKPIYVPKRAPKVTKDDRALIVDGVPKDWSQSVFLRAFAKMHPNANICSVRRLALGGWLIRLENPEEASRMIAEASRSLEHPDIAGGVHNLHIHKIGERTNHATQKIDMAARQVFCKIDPRSLDCVVNLDRIEENLNSGDNLDSLLEESPESEKKRILEAISRKIDENMSVDEPHKVTALNNKGAFVVEFESPNIAGKYLERGLPFRRLGYLLKCRRHIPDVRVATHFCSQCCQVGHLEVALQKS